MHVCVCVFCFFFAPALLQEGQQFVFFDGLGGIACQMKSPCLPCVIWKLNWKLQHSHLRRHAPATWGASRQIAARRAFSRSLAIAAMPQLCSRSAPRPALPPPRRSPRRRRRCRRRRHRRCHGSRHWPPPAQGWATATVGRSRGGESRSRGQQRCMGVSSNRRSSVGRTRGRDRLCGYCDCHCRGEAP